MIVLESSVCWAGDEICLARKGSLARTRGKLLRAKRGVEHRTRLKLADDLLILFAHLSYPLIENPCLNPLTIYLRVILTILSSKLMRAITACKWWRGVDSDKQYYSGYVIATRTCASISDSQSGFSLLLHALHLEAKEVRAVKRMSG